MWVQAEFSPDTFWHQTPRHFQLTMQGVRKRLKHEADAGLANAWQGGAFTGAAMGGKLKPLNHYLSTPGRAQRPRDMLAALLAHQAAGAKMTIRKR